MTPIRKQKLKGAGAHVVVVVDELESFTRELEELREAAELPPASYPTRQQRRKAERLQAKRRRGAK